jgi:hypothetical protein
MNLTPSRGECFNVIIKVLSTPLMAIATSVLVGNHQGILWLTFYQLVLNDPCECRSCHGSSGCDEPNRQRVEAAPCGRTVGDHAVDEA